jgi:hypothetical protein
LRLRCRAVPTDRRPPRTHHSQTVPSALPTLQSVKPGERGICVIFA